MWLRISRTHIQRTHGVYVRTWPLFFWIVIQFPIRSKDGFICELSSLDGFCGKQHGEQQQKHNTNCKRFNLNQRICQRLQFFSLNEKKRSRNNRTKMDGMNWAILFVSLNLYSQNGVFFDEIHHKTVGNYEMGILFSDLKFAFFFPYE